MAVHEPSQARTRAGIASVGLWFCVLIPSAWAFILTSGRCDNGSFDVSGSGVSRSSYCKATQFPRFPNSISSVLLDAFLFVLPGVAVLLGGVLAFRKADPLPLRWAGLLAGPIVVISLALIPLAHVRYLGAG